MEGVVRNMEQTNSTNYGYTPEQIKEMQAAFKSNDITGAISITPSADMSAEKARVYERTANVLSPYWLANLKELGIKRLMRNFSRDYPVKLLQNADGDYISEQLYNLYADPEQYKKAFEQFFEMYEQPICTGLEEYAKSIGKDVESLSDEEINYVIDKVADVINGELIKVVMLGQQVPEIYNIGKKNPEEKDFHIDEDICNFDLINFYYKWTHSNTKIGRPKLFCEFEKDDDEIEIQLPESGLVEDEEKEYESAEDAVLSDDAHVEIEYAELRKAFFEVLDSTEQEIYCLREDGYTQTEIAKRLGYKNPSGVSKRLKTIGKKWYRFINSIESKKQ